MSSSGSSLAHAPMQDATSPQGGEESAWSDQESSYLSPDDNAASPSQSLASSSPEPMDALDGLSFGTSSPELTTRLSVFLYLPRTNLVLMQDLSAEVSAACAPSHLILSHLMPFFD